MRPVTARGFRDVLPAEAGEREVLVGRISGVAASWGYERVETPVVERLDALEAAAGPLEGTAFRLVDLDGRLLALRPDLTVPIARLVSSRMAERAGAIRIRYAGEAFREHESLRGQSRQFTQVGVELVGVDGPAADAEVVAVLVDSLAAAGLESFTVGVGSVEVFSAVVSAASMPASWGSEVLAAAHDRNFVELQRLAALPGVAAEASRALMEVPRIRGGREAIGRCREVAAECGCGAALDTLDETFALLEAAGAGERVMVDFSIMRSFDYYTGIVIEAYAPGLGLAVGGGGRYDGVLGAFGTPRPAAGFALGLERLSIALVEQGVDVPVRRLDAVLGGAPDDALAAAARLRAAGWCVAISALAGRDLVAEANAAGAIEALVAEGGRVVRLDRSGEKATPLEEPLPYPPSTSWAEGSAR